MSALASQLRPSFLIIFWRHSRSIPNFRIEFLSSIGGRLLRPCLPPPFPVLRSNAKGEGWRVEKRMKECAKRDQVEETVRLCVAHGYILL